MIRIVGTLVTLLWLICMAALVQRDLMPFWRAQDPPASLIPGGRFQVAIENQAGRRLGSAWITLTRIPSYTTVHSLTKLDIGVLSPRLPKVGKLFLQTDLSYGENDKLDDFRLRLVSALGSANVTGARYDREYACTATIGDMTRKMSFDGRLTRELGDSLRPFTHLSGLHVGQSWRLRLIDPLALMTGQTLKWTSQLVEVTRREMILHRGRKVNCYRIQTDGAVAWADETGRVLRQEVRIPLLGTWILTTEPFDENARAQAEESAKKLREAVEG